MMCWMFWIDSNKLHISKSNQAISWRFWDMLCHAIPLEVHIQLAWTVWLQPTVVLVQIPKILTSSANLLHPTRQWNCWSLICMLQLHLHCPLNTRLQWTGLDNCKSRQVTFKVWDLVRLILESWRYYCFKFVQMATYQRQTNDQCNEHYFVSHCWTCYQYAVLNCFVSSYHLYIKHITKCKNAIPHTCSLSWTPVQV